jgi:hypothetical protein
MAAAWATGKCKYFLMGLEDWQLAIDHKPLILIMGNRALNLITHPRIMNQRVKLLLFKFTPINVPGKDNVRPETFSRRTDSPRSVAGRPFQQLASIRLPILLRLHGSLPLKTKYLVMVGPLYQLAQGNNTWRGHREPHHLRYPRILFKVGRGQRHYVDR